MNGLPRREFLASCGLGAYGMAVQSLLASDVPTKDAAPHHQPTAQSVILLFMSGGPSQVDTFDPKPELQRLAGVDVPPSIAANVPKIKRAGLSNLMPSPWEFDRYGDCGMPISTLFPKLAAHANDLCVIRSMTHRNPVHGPGECVALTGSGAGDRPSLGAWTIYGLGSETKRLPAFVAMNLHSDGMQHPQAAGWGSGFLPAAHQGTVVDSQRGIRDAQMPADSSLKERQRVLENIRRLNQRFLNQVGRHSELDARIRSYEMAFEMQSAGPELFDISSETESTRRLYGFDTPEGKSVAKACLLARRMVERGVRFVQVRVGGWDAHGNLKGNHERMAARTDAAIGGLITDLKQRGLLKSTLLLWGGEFGRTPTMEGRAKGRDHSPVAYSVWLAGGGVRGGQVIGETDPLGYTVVDRPVAPLDLHATVLHALGVDSERLDYDHHGLRETPLGVTGGAAISEVFS